MGREKKQYFRIPPGKRAGSRLQGRQGGREELVFAPRGENKRRGRCPGIKSGTAEYFASFQKKEAFFSEKLKKESWQSELTGNWKKVAETLGRDRSL